MSCAGARSGQRRLHYIIAALLLAYFVIYFSPSAPHAPPQQRRASSSRRSSAAAASEVAAGQLATAAAAAAATVAAPAADSAAAAPTAAAPAPALASTLPGGCAPGLYPARLPPCATQLHALIPSRLTDNNAKRRATIRFNLLKSFDPARFSLSYYFLVSPLPSEAAGVERAAALAALAAENATHGDMFYVPLDRTKPYAEEIYERDMVKKVWHEMAGLREGVAAASLPAYWAKFDDDVIVLWDKFFPALLKEMPSKELVWCAQGTGEYAQAGGYSGMYCNGPYLLSTDVVLKIAADEAQSSTETLEKHPDKEWHYNDDYVIIRRNFDNGVIKAFGADKRWHSDDKGLYAICVCKPWTLTSDSLVVHHPHPVLTRLWHENKTAFALVGHPLRGYGSNVCPPGSEGDPSCNHVEGCGGPPPIPAGCTISL